MYFDSNKTMMNYSICGEIELATDSRIISNGSKIISNDSKIISGGANGFNISNEQDILGGQAQLQSQLISKFIEREPGESILTRIWNYFKKKKEKIIPIVQLNPYLAIGSNLEKYNFSSNFFDNYIDTSEYLAFVLYQLTLFIERTYGDQIFEDKNILYYFTSVLLTICDLNIFVNEINVNKEDAFVLIKPLETELMKDFKVKVKSCLFSFWMLIKILVQFQQKLGEIFNNINEIWDSDDDVKYQTIIDNAIDNDTKQRLTNDKIAFDNKRRNFDILKFYLQLGFLTEYTIKRESKTRFFNLLTNEYSTSTNNFYFPYSKPEILENLVVMISDFENNISNINLPLNAEIYEIYLRKKTYIERLRAIKKRIVVSGKKSGILTPSIFVPTPVSSAGRYLLTLPSVILPSSNVPYVINQEIPNEELNISSDFEMKINPYFDLVPLIEQFDRIENAIKFVNSWTKTLKIIVDYELPNLSSSTDVDELKKYMSWLVLYSNMFIVQTNERNIKDVYYYFDHYVTTANLIIEKVKDLEYIKNFIDKRNAIKKFAKPLEQKIKNNRNLYKSNKKDDYELGSKNLIDEILKLRSILINIPQFEIKKFKPKEIPRFTSFETFNFNKNLPNEHLIELYNIVNEINNTYKYLQLLNNGISDNSNFIRPTTELVEKIFDFYINDSPDNDRNFVQTFSDIYPTFNISYQIEALLINEKLIDLGFNNGINKSWFFKYQFKYCKMLLFNASYNYCLIQKSLGNNDNNPVREKYIGMLTRCSGLIKELRNKRNLIDFVNTLNKFRDEYSVTMNEIIDILYKKYPKSKRPLYIILLLSKYNYSDNFTDKLILDNDEIIKLRTNLLEQNISCGHYYIPGIHEINKHVNIIDDNLIEDVIYYSSNRKYKTGLVFPSWLSIIQKVRTLKESNSVLIKYDNEIKKIILNDLMKCYLKSFSQNISRGDKLLIIYVFSYIFKLASLVKSIDLSELTPRIGNIRDKFIRRESIRSVPSITFTDDEKKRMFVSSIDLINYASGLSGNDWFNYTSKGGNITITNIEKVKEFIVLLMNVIIDLGLFLYFTGVNDKYDRTIVKVVNGIEETINIKAMIINTGILLSIVKNRNDNIALANTFPDIGRLLIHYFDILMRIFNETSIFSPDLFQNVQKIDNTNIKLDVFNDLVNSFFANVFFDSMEKLVISKDILTFNNNFVKMYSKELINSLESAKVKTLPENLKKSFEIIKERIRISNSGNRISEENVFNNITALLITRELFLQYTSSFGSIDISSKINYDNLIVLEPYVLLGKNYELNNNFIIALIDYLSMFHKYQKLSKSNYDKNIIEKFILVRSQTRAQRLDTIWELMSNSLMHMSFETFALKNKNVTELLAVKKINNEVLEKISDFSIESKFCNELSLMIEPWLILSNQDTLDYLKTTLVILSKTTGDSSDFRITLLTMKLIFALELIKTIEDRFRIIGFEAGIVIFKEKITQFMGLAFIDGLVTFESDYLSKLIIQLLILLNGTYRTFDIEIIRMQSWKPSVLSTRIENILVNWRNRKPDARYQRLVDKFNRTKEIKSDTIFNKQQVEESLGFVELIKDPSLYPQGIDPNIHFKICNNLDDCEKLLDQKIAEITENSKFNNKSFISKLRELIDKYTDSSVEIEVEKIIETESEPRIELESRKRWLGIFGGNGNKLMTDNNEILGGKSPEEIDEYESYKIHINLQVSLRTTDIDNFDENDESDETYNLLRDIYAKISEIILLETIFKYEKIETAKNLERFDENTINNMKEDFRKVLKDIFFINETVYTVDEFKILLNSLVDGLFNAVTNTNIINVTLLKNVYSESEWIDRRVFFGLSSLSIEPNYISPKEMKLLQVYDMISYFQKSDNFPWWVFDNGDIIIDDSTKVKFIVKEKKSANIRKSMINYIKKKFFNILEKQVNPELNNNVFSFIASSIKSIYPSDYMFIIIRDFFDIKKPESDPILYLDQFINDNKIKEIKLLLSEKVYLSINEREKIYNLIDKSLALVKAEDLHEYLSRIMKVLWIFSYQTVDNVEINNLILRCLAYTFAFYYLNQKGKSISDYQNFITDFLKEIVLSIHFGIVIKSLYSLDNYWFPGEFKSWKWIPFLFDDKESTKISTDFLNIPIIKRVDYLAEPVLDFAPTTNELIKYVEYFSSNSSDFSIKDTEVFTRFLYLINYANHIGVRYFDPKALTSFLGNSNDLLSEYVELVNIYERHQEVLCDFIDLNRDNFYYNNQNLLFKIKNPGDLSGTIAPFYCYSNLFRSKNIFDIHLIVLISNFLHLVQISKWISVFIPINEMENSGIVSYLERVLGFNVNINIVNDVKQLLQRIDDTSKSDEMNYGKIYITIYNILADWISMYPLIKKYFIEYMISNNEVMSFVIEEYRKTLEYPPYVIGEGCDNDTDKQNDFEKIVNKSQSYFSRLTSRNRTKFIEALGIINIVTSYRLRCLYNKMLTIIYTKGLYLTCKEALTIKFITDILIDIREVIELGSDDDINKFYKEFSVKSNTILKYIANAPANYDDLLIFISPGNASYITELKSLMKKENVKSLVQIDDDIFRKLNFNGLFIIFYLQNIFNLSKRTSNKERYSPFEGSFIGTKLSKQENINIVGNILTNFAPQYDELIKDPHLVQAAKQYFGIIEDMNMIIQDPNNPTKVLNYSSPIVRKTIGFSFPSDVLKYLQDETKNNIEETVIGRSIRDNQDFVSMLFSKATSLFNESQNFCFYEGINDTATMIIDSISEVMKTLMDDENKPIIQTRKEKWNYLVGVLNETFQILRNDFESMKDFLSVENSLFRSLTLVKQKDYYKNYFELSDHFAIVYENFMDIFLCMALINPQIRGKFDFYDFFLNTIYFNKTDPIYKVFDVVPSEDIKNLKENFQENEIKLILGLLINKEDQRRLKFYRHRETSIYDKYSLISFFDLEHAIHHYNRFGLLLYTSKQFDLLQNNIVDPRATDEEKEIIKRIDEKSLCLIRDDPFVLGSCLNRENVLENRDRFFNFLFHISLDNSIFWNMKSFIDYIKQICYKLERIDLLITMMMLNPKGEDCYEKLDPNLENIFDFFKTLGEKRIEISPLLETAEYINNDNNYFTNHILKYYNSLIKSSESQYCLKQTCKNLLYLNDANVIYDPILHSNFIKGNINVLLYYIKYLIVIVFTKMPIIRDVNDIFSNKLPVRKDDFESDLRVNTWFHLSKQFNYDASVNQRSDAEINQLYENIRTVNNLFVNFVIYDLNLNLATNEKTVLTKELENVNDYASGRITMNEQQYYNTLTSIRFRLEKYLEEDINLISMIPKLDFSPKTHFLLTNSFVSLKTILIQPREKELYYTTSSVMLTIHAYNCLKFLFKAGIKNSDYDEMFNNMDNKTISNDNDYISLVLFIAEMYIKYRSDISGEDLDRGFFKIEPNDFNKITEFMKFTNPTFKAENFITYDDDDERIYKGKFSKLSLIYIFFLQNYFDRNRALSNDEIPEISKEYNETILPQLKNMKLSEFFPRIDFNNNFLCKSVDDLIARKEAIIKSTPEIIEPINEKITEIKNKEIINNIETNNIQDRILIIARFLVDVSRVYFINDNKIVTNIMDISNDVNIRINNFFKNMNDNTWGKLLSSINQKISQLNDKETKIYNFTNDIVNSVNAILSGKIPNEVIDTIEMLTNITQSIKEQIQIINDDAIAINKSIEIDQDTFRIIQYEKVFDSTLALTIKDVNRLDEIATNEPPIEPIIIITDNNEINKIVYKNFMISMINEFNNSSDIFLNILIIIEKIYTQKDYSNSDIQNLIGIIRNKYVNGIEKNNELYNSDNNYKYVVDNFIKLINEFPKPITSSVTSGGSKDRTNKYYENILNEINESLILGTDLDLNDDLIGIDFGFKKSCNYLFQEYTQQMNQQTEHLIEIS